MKKNFIVQSRGVIQGGTVSYSADPVTGHLTCDILIKVGKWFFSHTQEYHEAYDADPKILKPETVSKPGAVVPIAGVATLTVTNVTPDYSDVDVRVASQSSIQGKARLLTGSRDIIEIQNMELTGNISGFDVDIDCEPAANMNLFWKSVELARHPGLVLKLLSTVSGRRTDRK